MAGSLGAALLARVLLLSSAGWAWSLPPGFPAPRVPADNPMSAEKVALGRRLFYDKRLSGNGGQSCASCHQQARAFTDGRAHAIGSTGELHPRSAMSLANGAYAASLTWGDLGKHSLEDQAAVPMTNEHPVEMGLKGHEGEALARFAAEPLYPPLFARAFPAEGEPMTLANVRKAIASFERTLLSGGSAYDRLVWRDDRSALSDSASRGMALFFSDRLSCGKCHAGFTFSGPAVWEGGPDAEPSAVSNGLSGTERFRVPTLRNIAVTAPYMHDGRFADLGAVVDHYARGGIAGADRSRFVTGFTISEEGKRDLIAFLESLTDGGFLTNPDLSDPWEPEERPGPPR